MSNQSKRRLYLSALIAAGFVVFGLYNLYFSSVSKNWPNAIGTITESNVLSPASHQSWRVRLRYQFQVNGVQRSDDTYRFGGSPYFSRQAAETVAAQYVPGQPVKVFYDPNNPDRAVLISGIDSGNWLDFAYCIGGLIGFIYCIKKLFATPNRTDTPFENAKNTQIPV